MKKVLLIEDNEDDIYLTLKACEGAPSAPEIEVVRDGQEAMDHLSAEGSHTGGKNDALPDFIFLDIKLPVRNGFEVLEWIRAKPEFKNIPVIMLSGSDQSHDIERAYGLGATSYLSKISDPETFRHAVQLVLAYWLEINIPANREAHSRK